MAKEDTKTNKFDVAVIGAGPAGLISAFQAARNGLRVVLIEKNSAFGKKFLLTGGGRCNLTNAEFDLRKLAENYNNGEFLFHAFSVFGPKETIEFFEKLGIKTKTENNKRVFPKNQDAKQILETFKKYLTENRVEILLNSEILDFEKKAGNITKIILKSGEISAKQYILATGGKSYSKTGSDGFGYQLAEKLGHKIEKPTPALSPIMLKEEWIKNLQGLSLADIQINVFQNNKKQFSEQGEILFTHYGLTGPAALNISGKVESLLEKGEVKIIMDLFPLLNQELLLEGLEKDLKKYPKQTIKNILSVFVPERMAGAVLDIAKIDKNKIANNISKVERAEIVKTLKNIELTAQEVFGFEAAMVTKGGISLKEIDHKTMQSKIIKNLSFAGEILDVDGKTGGFNLQLCWSSGYIAGQNCK